MMVRTVRPANPELRDFPVLRHRHRHPVTSRAENVRMDPRAPPAQPDPQAHLELPVNLEKRGNPAQTAKPDQPDLQEPRDQLDPTANPAQRDLPEHQDLVVAKAHRAQRDPTEPRAKLDQPDLPAPKVPMANLGQTDRQDHPDLLEKTEFPALRDPRAHPDLQAPTLSIALAQNVLVALLWPKPKRKRNGHQHHQADHNPTTSSSLSSLNPRTILTNTDLIPS
jgi:hypothetical protein